MKFAVCLLVLILFALSIRANYVAPMPCRDVSSCNAALPPQSKPICLSNICMCPNLKTKLYEFCVNQNPIVGSPRSGGEDERGCKSDNDCSSIEGAKCLTSDHEHGKRLECKCDPTMVMSEDKRRCLPVATDLMGHCNESAQCSMHLGGSECYNGVCRCMENFHYASSKKHCILNKGYGEKCTQDDESCYQRAGINKVNALGCSDKNICKCRKNYHLVNGLCQSSGATRTVIQLMLVMVLAIIPLISIL